MQVLTIGIVMCEMCSHTPQHNTASQGSHFFYRICVKPRGLPYITASACELAFYRYAYNNECVYKTHRKNKEKGSVLALCDTVWPSGEQLWVSLERQIVDIVFLPR